MNDDNPRAATAATALPRSHAQRYPEDREHCLECVSSRVGA